MGWKWRWQVYIFLMALFSMVAGCATPRIQAVDPQLFLNSEMSFLKDGATTREEVSLKLGVPSAQQEGDRILMYQFRADEAGKWHLISPKFSGSLGAWEPGGGAFYCDFRYEQMA